MSEPTATQGTQAERLQASLKDFVAERDYFERVSNQHYDKWRDAEKRIKALQQQNKQLIEAVNNHEFYPKLDEDIPDDKESAYELGYKDALWNLSDAIESIQGGTSDERTNHTR